MDWMTIKEIALLYGKTENSIRKKIDRNNEYNYFDQNKIMKVGKTIVIEEHEVRKHFSTKIFRKGAFKMKNCKNGTCDIKRCIGTKCHCKNGCNNCGYNENGVCKVYNKKIKEDK